MKIFKKIILSIFACVFLCAALYYSALIIIVNFADLNKYTNSISKSIEQTTGFKVSCENIYFKKSLSPYLKIHLSHTLVLYPNDEVFLKLKETDLQVKILPLLIKKIEIKDVYLTRPIINITLYKDFSTSLEKYIDTSKTFNTKGFKLNSEINDTICENYKIKFKDDSINKTFYLEGSSLLLKDFKLNDKAHFAMKGAVFENKNEYINYDIDITANLNSQKKHFTFSPFKTILNSNVKGSVLGHLKIDKENKITGNLNINNLSLKIDNVISRDNTADLIFNGDEAEINSVIHTSDTDSVDIKGKFALGKKKYIDLNTNAKNINIENLIKIVSGITKILNIDNPLNDISGKGILDAKFNINSDFKKLKSSGSANIINASFSHKLIPYSLTGINASVNLENNNISVDEAAAMLNGTPVKIKGRVNEDVSFSLNAHSENLNLLNFINLFKLDKKIPVTFTNGKLSVIADITGVLNNSYNVKSKIYLSDLKFTDKKNNIPAEIKSAILDFQGNDKKYRGLLLCKDTSLKYLNKEISTPELKFLYDENKITIPNSTLYSPLNLIVSGTINEYNKNPYGNISFKGDINSDFIAQMIKAQIKFPYKAAGKIKTEGKIDFNSEKTSVKSKFRADENNYISYIVIKELLNKPSLLNIDCEIKDNVYNIKDLSLYENKNNAVISSSGQVINNVTLNNFKLIIPNPVTVASNFFGGEEVSFNADITLNKSLEKPEIKGSAKVFKYNIKKYLTSVKNADISFNNDNIRIIAPEVIVNNSIFNIIADLSSLSDIKNIVVSNLQINSMNLDLNPIFPFIQKENNPFSSAALTVKKGIVTVNKFKILDLKAEDISSDIQIEKNIIKLSDINAGAYMGQIQGKIDYDLNRSYLDMNMTGKGLDIKTSLYDLCKIEDNLEGKADFTAKISMYTGLYKDVIKSLNGNMKFTANNGKMGTLGKFEYYLYAQNIIYHGLLNATLNRLADAVKRDDTAKYKQAKGTLLFQNGYILSDDIETTGVNMSLFMKGKHNLITNTSNIDIFGRISDEVKSKLTTFGNTSFSELFNTNDNKTNIKPITIPNTITDKIPYLYNQKEDKTNLFKVNIYGNINSLNAINSFDWIVPNNAEEKEEKLPDFSDMMQDL